MRVFVLCHFFTPYMKMVSNFMHHQGYEVHVLSSQDISHFHYPFTCHQYQTEKLPFAYSELTIYHMVHCANQVHEYLLYLWQQHIQPDLIISSCQYAESYYVPHIFPTTRLITIVSAIGNETLKPFGTDFFHNHHQKFFMLPKDIYTRKAFYYQIFEQSDILLMESFFQKTSIPECFQHKAQVFPLPVLSDVIKPNPESFIELNNTKRLDKYDDIICFYMPFCEIAYGYDVIIKALPLIFERCPMCHIMIVGNMGHYYNIKLPNNQSYKNAYWHIIQDIVPNDQVHFVGNIGLNHFVSLLQISACFCYLTYPYPIDHGLLKAMSCGTPIVASDTAPINELCCNEEEALLVHCHDHYALAEHVIALVENKDIGSILGKIARKKILKTYQFNQYSVEQMKDIFL